MCSNILQLTEEIKKTPETIINSFNAFNILDIEITRFSTGSQIEPYFGIYCMKKASCTSEIDAFLKLWLAELIVDYEWYEQINSVSSHIAKWILDGTFTFSVEEDFEGWAERGVNQRIDGIYQSFLFQKERSERIGLIELGLFKLDSQMNFQKVNVKLNSKESPLKIDGIIKVVKVSYDAYFKGQALFVETDSDYILMDPD